MKFPKRRCWRILLILLLCETVLSASCVYAGALKAEDIEIGNTVTFGKYEQDRSKSGKEELEWRVLEKDTDKKMIILEPSEEMVDYIRKYLPNGAYRE